MLFFGSRKNFSYIHGMNREQVQSIIKEVYPKIEKHYGYSKYHNCTPLVEVHHNIYVRLTGENYDESVLTETECDPDAEFDRQDNTIVLYWPKMKSKKLIIQTLIHEYQHYLQSPIWMKRYYSMGHEYPNHPYEVEATKEEKNWSMFV